MKIDGKALAEAILNDLTDKVSALKERGTVPTLAVILVGDNPESIAYIRQKQKATERIGARFIFEHLPTQTKLRELSARIQMYNDDPAVHGLIVQRPLPPNFGDATVILHAVAPPKDVDGFVPHSPFDVPIATAVLNILEKIFSEEKNTNDFLQWLQAKTITIIGRGETAGKPVAMAFEKRQCATSVIHSQTENPKDVMKSADILISCVGRKRVVTPDAIKPGAILISVGLWRGNDNKLHGDYNEEEIKDIASYYTPTPGGVGPLNIASLMQNLVKASTMK